LHRPTKTLLAHEKPGQSGQLYWSKSPAEKKWASIEGIFKPAERYSPWDGSEEISVT